MRYSATTLLMALCLSFVSHVHAEERIPVFFILTDNGVDFEVWLEAVRGAGRKGLVRTYRGQKTVEEARRDAASLGVTTNTVLLATVNTRDKNSSEFQRSTHAEPHIKGLKKLFEWPMCMLLEEAGSGGRLPTNVLVVLDNRQAKAICYAAVQAYFTTAPGPDGSRAAPVFVDPLATVLQAAMPPMKVMETFLAYKSASGSFARRGSNVYSRGEEIVIFAQFDHVGRKLPGTPFGRYEIGLDIEIRDSGGDIDRIPNAHTYEGKSTQRFPLDAEYFRNHATASVKLLEAGAYKVAFIFTDRSRPANETTPIEAVFDITIK